METEQDMNPNTKVRDIMTTSVITLHPEDSLRIVENTFASKPFHHIPIVDTSRKVVGIISKMDLLQLSVLKRDIPEKDFMNIMAKDFMTRSTVQVTPDQTVADVAEIFNENKFHALPVVEGGELVGIVTTHDLIQFMFGFITVPEI